MWTMDYADGYFPLSASTRAKWLGRLADAGITKVFCGHYHRNAGGYTNDRKLEVVVTSAVGRQLSAAEAKLNRFVSGPEGISEYKAGFRIVTVTEDTITHAYREFGEVEVELECGDCI